VDAHNINNINASYTLCWLCGLHFWPLNCASCIAFHWGNISTKFEDRFLVIVRAYFVPCDLDRWPLNLKIALRVSYICHGKPVHQIWMFQLSVILELQARQHRQMKSDMLISWPRFFLTFNNASCRHVQLFCKNISIKFKDPIWPSVRK